MADTIYRQAAIDALDEIESEVADGYGYQYEKWRKYFCGLPSAQPEIIRCEDCAKCQTDDVYHDYWCDGRKVWRDHFCGYAERRTDE